VGQFNRQGLSTDCVSCHLRAFQRATAPNHQALGYSTDCRQCHTSMDSWMTAIFPHTRARR
jgi:5-methylcytosine-specific restriction endonuclease McrA